MDVFMANIASSASPVALKTEIAKKIHHQDYSHHRDTALPLNFAVHILPRRGHAPSRCGILTLPTQAVAEQFLREFGGSRPRRTITVHTRIAFSRGRKPPRRDILEEIRRLPFVDPEAERRREQTEQELQTHVVQLKCVQFGWECRDNVFSAEWEYQCPGHGTVMYNQERREFRVKVFGAQHTYHIAIHAIQVKWASAEVAEDTSPVIFFNLTHPPSYETEPPQSIEAMLSSLSLAPQAVQKRHRWAGVDTSHSVISPYISLAIRLECQGDSDLRAFRSIAKIARIGLESFTYPVVRRNLFSEEIRTQYDAWVLGLPWKVAFGVESLTRRLLVDLREVMGLRERIKAMIDAKGVPHVVDFLRHFATKAKLWYHYSDDTRSPTGTVEELFVQCEQDYVPRPPSLSRAGPAETFDCLHVTVTPTTFTLDGPFPERSNRVMRRYPDNHDSFLRVNFADETKLQFRFDREVDGNAFIKRRVGSILSDGLWIAGRHFEFLAYSQSALKEHAVWFVKEFITPSDEIVNAASIIAGLGKFHGLDHDPHLMNCPARYGARISQAFTATDSSLSIEAEEVFPLVDIMDGEGKWCFTDGVGTISPELARAIWKELRARRGRTGRTPPYPRAFQIRFMGSKGMLSVDHTLSGYEVGLRPSMIKFEALNSRDIEIARAFDKPGPFYLNRPLIMILEGLGVPYEAFQDLQDTAVKEANRSTESLALAAKLMERYGLGTSFRLTSVMLSLDKLGVGPLFWDTFWTQMMDFAINHVLRELKHRARIPVENAWNLVGVADIHGYLEENEVFAYIAPTNGAAPVYLEGPTLISRSPTIHPGDVQVVHAIGRPPLGSPFEKEPLRNCLVFSIKGARPLPTFLGGGDLDGDVYCCTMLEQLLPPHNYQPAPYTPATRKNLPRPSTMQDVAEFVTDYLCNDNLGIIALAWLVIADQSPQSIFDPDCLKLSALHSDAVDYPKSGTPVDPSRIPKYKFRTKPDWNAPETIPNKSANYYESQRAIGRLYREIKLPALQIVRQALRTQSRSLREGQQVTLRDVLDAFEDDFEPDEEDLVRIAVQGRVMDFIALGAHDENLIAEIWELFESYVIQFQTICFDHTLSTSKTEMLTEEEAVVGTIVAKCSQPRARKDMMSKLREQTTVLVQGVAHELAGEDGTLFEKSMERAWVAYRMACMEKDCMGAKSFAWIALGEIFDAIKKIEESEGTL